MVRRYVCLTRREEEIMDLLLEFKAHGIAARYLVGAKLGITESAVNSCLSRVRKKLDDARLARRRYRDLLKRRR